MQQKLKVLMLNGSPRANGNTSVALKEMEQVFKDNGIETEIILVGNKDIRGCIACGSCYEKGKCVFNDMVNELALKFEDFTISGMPVASSQYWNSIHGRMPGESEQDGEGKQTMRTLARNMTFLMKSIALGKEQFGLPEKEERIATHFIR